MIRQYGCPTHGIAWLKDCTSCSLAKSLHSSSYWSKLKYRLSDPDRARRQAREWNRKTYKHTRVLLTKDPKIRFEMAKQKRLNQRMKKYPEAQEALRKQNGLCAICGNPETTIKRGVIQQLSLDHNHETGEFRGWLCLRCNNALGLIGESIDILHKMEEYLERAG